MPKGLNPKGLALFASGLLNSGNHKEAKALLNKLKALRCEGYSDACWGYNFDWQARAHLTTLGTPNIVTTVFVANAFLDCFERTNEEECLDLAESACQFFLKNLIMFEDESRLCFGYVPGADVRVHNVNMMAAALLARVYSITGDRGKLDISRKSMTYSVNALSDKGSWCYGEFEYQKFIDNFHTGFNLVALSDWMKFTGESIWEVEINKAYRYYLENFWESDCCPKYYNNSVYPIDIHCSAQGIVTFVKLRGIDSISLKMADNIAQWAIINMQDTNGYFYYQKNRYYTNKISYIRWSQSWMFYALSLYLDTVDL